QNLLFGANRSISVKSSETSTPLSHSTTKASENAFLPVAALEEGLWDNGRPRKRSLSRAPRLLRAPCFVHPIMFYGAGQDKLGIYIKSVVKGGAADVDGQLQAGDQLLKVDGQSLVGITQEK
ncbi:unnamed protein product, partial [Timema podura]|nr:unnamed protein product [Timema podura]